MSRLSAVTSSPTMREYAQGAAQRSVQPIANFLAPGVDVSTMIGQYKVYDEASRFKIPNTLRGLGGKATRLTFDASDATYNCQPHAIDIVEDNLVIGEGADLENIVMENADMAAQVAALSHEKKVVDLALAAAGAGTDKDFTSTSIDPIDEIDDKILTVLKAAKSGSLMNVRVLFGATAWKRTKNNTNVKAAYRASGTGKNTVSVTPSLNDFGGLLLAKPECEVSLMVYDDAKEGLAESNQFVLDDAVLVFATLASPTRRDPSFMKTFRLRGGWMVPGSYETEDGRNEAVKMDWSEDTKVTNSAAVARINANNS